MKSKLSLQFLTASILAILMSLDPAAAQRVSDIELLLREALHKQQVDGDLPGAIKLYQQIVATRNGNRTLISRALLELAGCYEKLGQQAETVYQQIVRDYADQPAASQARAKLAALRPPAPPPKMTLSQIELGEGIRNVVDGDSKRAVYWDSTRTRLFLGDLAGKKNKLILETKGAPSAYVSRDLSLVFLYFPLSAQGGSEKFAIIKTDGTNYRELGLTDNGNPLQVLGLGPSCASWSWDNRYLLLCKPESAGTRLLKISLADLKIQDLLPGKPVVGSRVRVAEFSPDGHYIAYGGGPTYIIPAQGGDSRLLAAGGLVDWSADGRYVIIGEPRAGAMVLDAVPVTAGQPSGESISLRSVPGPILFARTMPSGALLLAQQPQDIRAISLGVLDANEKSVTWSRLELIGLRLPTPVAWSPDGSRFAYVSGVFGTATRVVRIKDLTRDDDRELFRRDSPLPGCTWAHNQPTIYCTQSLDTKTNILSASESGSVEVIGSLAGPKTMVQITSDDRKLVLVRPETVDWVEWDIATGLEKTLSFMRSTDGRWSLGRMMTPGRPGVMTIRPAAGTDSDWRPLAVRRIPGAGPIPTVFSSDGKWVIYHDRDMDGKDGLYRVATDGSGEPERLGDYPTDSPTSALSVSRDGRKFLVNAPKPFQPELWILENFLPVTPATPTPAAKAGTR